MDAGMRKHRMTCWLGRLLPSLSSATLLLFVMISPASAFVTVGGTQTFDYPDVKLTVTVPANLTVPHLSYYQPSSFQDSIHIELLSAGSVAAVLFQENTCGTTVMINGIPYACDLWKDGTLYFLSILVGVKTPWPGGSVLYVEFDFLLAEKLPDSLTITLSGGTEVEPSNGSDKKFLPIIATVIHQSTQKPPTNPVKVHVSLKVDPKTGGHDHGDNTRPRGGIADVETCASDSECWPAPQSTDGKGMTDGNGQVVFNFKAPEASGTHTISATCDGCSNTATKPVNVKVDGLELIPTVPLFYSLVEANGDVIGARTGWHTDNHNLTHAAAQRLMQIAALYRSPKFMMVVDKKTGRKAFPPVLHINDASLPWGGVYDICARPGACPDDGVIAWLGPHKEHRRGTVVDVRANGDDGSIPESNKREFVKLLKKKEMPYLLESAGTSNEHFHLRLMGKKE